MDDRLPMKRAAAARAGNAITAVALAAVAAAACASNSAADNGGAGGSGGDGGSPADAGPLHCSVQITNPEGTPDGGLTAGTQSTLRLLGVETVPPGASYTWNWSVTFADGSAVPVTTVGQGGRLIEFPLAKPGSYTVDVELVGGTYCAGEQTYQVPAVGARLGSFRIRFVPSDTNQPPAQDQTLQVSGGAPYRKEPFHLSSGTIVRFDPRDATPAAGRIPAYVRINDTASGRLVTEAHTPVGKSIDLHLVDGTYDMLIVPDGDVAPMLLKGKTPTELAAMPIAMPVGTAVTGTVVDGAAAPLAGARVALHAGPLPSTLAVTDSAGRFTLHASPGTFGATITQVMGNKSILEATLMPSPGVTIDAGAGTAPPPSLAIAINAPVARGNAGLSITAAQAASLAAGSKVVVESAAPLLNVATVSVGGRAAQAAAVRIRSELAPQVSGSNPLSATVSIAGLVAAHYRATVFPAVADGPDAITGTDLDLSSGVAPSATALALGAKVTLGGQLVPGGQTDGVQVTALDVGGDFPLAVAGQSMANGQFKIAVSSGRTYRLRAQPSAGQPLARALFGPVMVGTMGATLGQQTMQNGLLFSSILEDATNPIGGALVQVFCVASTLSCTDPETPIAETVTRVDGFFQLTLPDPGVDP